MITCAQTAQRHTRQEAAGAIVQAPGLAGRLLNKDQGSKQLEPSGRRRAYDARRES
jgi:hypothetical protein